MAFPLAACLAILVGVATGAAAADWPTYLNGPARAGATTDDIGTDLHLSWKFSSPAPPKMAWAGPNDRTFEGHELRDRVAFDDTFPVVIAGGRVYFGSSVDHQLRCLDAATGQLVWKFYTGGPIRLAPSLDGGRVYFGSDDGYAYCLNAENGEVVWKLRAGPEDDWLLARGEMVSRWPVRTGILVEDGVAYFGAGIFPAEVVYLYAVQADDGSIVWKRDDISQSDAGRNDLSPQGYLLAEDDRLFVPSGRSLPAGIDRRTGEMLHKASPGWRSDAGGVVGGSQAMLADGQLFAWGDHHILAIDQKTGKVGFGWFEGDQMAVAGDKAYIATGDVVRGLDRLEYAAGSRERHDLEMKIYSLTRQLRGADGEKAKEIRDNIAAMQQQIRETERRGILWEQPCTAEASLILAGETVVVGGQDQVFAYNSTDGRGVWQTEIDGEARSLAVSDGRLFVSTTQGDVLCFSADDRPNAATTAANNNADTSPYPEDDWSPIYAQAAREILDRADVRRGFCLVLGSEEGRLAYEIARQSDLRVYGLEPDADKVVRARNRLSQAGLYGHRVTIHHAELSPVPYSSYFANLIVSESLLRHGRLDGNPAEIVRHLKPLGGKVVLGRPANAPGSAPSVEDLSAWLNGMDLADAASVQRSEQWVTLTRGALPGAGNWTHQYGEPGNTAASDDRLVRGGMGVLWYGDPGPGEMVNRHDGAVGPVSANGRLFVQGADSVMAYDAYNGQFLWEVEETEAIRTGVFRNESPGNLVASDDSLYVMIRGRCVRFDAATGEILATYKLPEGFTDKKHEWGYLAYQDGLLFGTATTRELIDERQRRRGKASVDNTDAIFAIDTSTGEVVWTYQGKSIAHHTIALGEGKVFLIDSTITSEQRAALLREDKTELAKLTGDEAKLAEERMKNLDARLAVAIDARSGEVLWSEAVDVTDCSEIGTGGGKLTLMYQNNVLVLCGANANGHYWAQFMSGEFSRRRLVALSATDGKKLWAKDANYRHRPIIVEDRIIAEPWGFDLYTGAQQMRQNALTGQLEPWSIMRSGHHCGMLSASPNLLFFRSGFSGFYDLQADAGTSHFAGHRTGCWINMIPANGLLMIPEASAGCVCLFSIASTIVMEPKAEHTPWAIYSSTGPQTPVKHMAINLGAPGDRRDGRGQIWLAYPRPKPSRATSLDLSLDFQPKFLPEGGYASRNADAVEIEDTDVPWVLASNADGLTQLRVPVLGSEDDPAVYTLRLHFAELDNAAPGARLFDVHVQGKAVIEKLDVAAAAGGTSNAVTREVRGIAVTDALEIELVPHTLAGGEPARPILNGFEIVREDGGGK